MSRSRILFAVVAAVGVGTISAVVGDFVGALRAQQNLPEATQPPASEDEIPRSLDIVVAEHVMLWDGEIKSWKEIVDGLRAMRKQAGKPIQPNFHFTNKGFADGKREKLNDGVFEVYKELFEPAGYSITSISPRMRERYDAIRGPADLIPKPELVRTGIIRGPSGRPAWRATVILVPEEALLPVMLRPEISLRDPIALRDTLDEVWALTDKEGRFTIASPDSGNRLVVLSPQGFAIAPVPKVGEPIEIRLEARCEIEVSSADKRKPMLGVAVHLAELPKSHAGFEMYEFAIGEEPLVIPLPPGRVTVKRSFEVSEDKRGGLPSEKFDLKAGERKTLGVPSPESSWIPKF